MGPKWSNIGPKVHGEAKSGLGQMGTFCASWRSLRHQADVGHSSENTFGLLKTGKRINLWVCDIMIIRKRFLGRPMSIMSLPTPQGRRKTQAKHTCFLGILSSIDRQDKDISTQQCYKSKALYLCCLGQDEKWDAKNDWKVSSSRIIRTGHFHFKWNYLLSLSIRRSSRPRGSLGLHSKHRNPRGLPETKTC